MSILVIKQGILTTVQDLGRFGFQRYGVNPNGVMDRAAARLLNTLIGNDDNAALLELHFPAGEYLFEAATAFAVGGADLSSELSDRTVPNWTVLAAEAGDILTFRKPVFGNRAYLAVRGGVVVEQWLNSSSTNLMAGAGGFHGRRLCTGDRIAVGTSVNETPVGAVVAQSSLPAYSRSPIIRFISGPEFDRLSENSRVDLFAQPVTITKDSDRIGYRLAGPTLRTIDNSELLSSGVTFGTIQLLPDGHLIVLMADHQTTGGYPRIGNVAAVDLPLLAQLGPGDHFRFQKIEVEVAEELLLNFEKRISFLRAGLQMRSDQIL
jgi:antagonist of KipI